MSKNKEDINKKLILDKAKNLLNKKNKAINEAKIVKK